MEMLPMKETMSRREALKNLALGAGTLLAVSRTGLAAADAAAGGALPHVSPTDPVAIALAYHENSSTVEAAKFPTYKPEQKCSNCLQLKGNAGDTWRPCNLFPGKLVNAEGWCKVYVKKP
jgi:hypothetical protein